MKYLLRTTLLGSLSLGRKYDVGGIPFALLVDGDTGKILGTSRELRGAQLSEFIGKKLKEKRGE